MFEQRKSFKYVTLETRGQIENLHETFPLQSMAKIESINNCYMVTKVHALNNAFNAILSVNKVLTSRILKDFVLQEGDYTRR